MFFNQLKTVILLGSLSALLMLFGYLLGGSSGIIMALTMSLAMNFIAYFYSDKIVLNMYGAQPLDRDRYKYIHDMVRDLCDKAGLPMPKLWYIPTRMANAFATGRNPEHASVAVTQGILDILDEKELRGVLAHEISHVKNRDILIATIAATFATAIGYVANMLQWAALFGGTRNHRDDRSGNDQRMGIFGALVAAILLPIAATLLQLAISRSREYLADESGAEICHDPLALASALEKLHSSAQKQHLDPESSVQVSTASLFIVYPFALHGLMHLFATHPPMEDRIRRLKKMAR